MADFSRYLSGNIEDRRGDHTLTPQPQLRRQRLGESLRGKTGEGMTGRGSTNLAPTDYNSEVLGTTQPGTTPGSGNPPLDEETIKLLSMMAQSLSQDSGLGITPLQDNRTLALQQNIPYRANRFGLGAPGSPTPIITPPTWLPDWVFKY